MTLDKLIYSNNLDGTLQIYVYTSKNDTYLIRQYFSRQPQYPDEETTVDRAFEMVREAVKCGLQVRITNGADFLVFHSMNGDVLYPEQTTVEEFFGRI